jgi:hypothetical protein
VQVKVVPLEEDDIEAGTREAKKLVDGSDTLLVIGHLPSPLIEDSLFTYFHADPPVPFLATTASDEDLLVKCRHNARSCFQDGWFAPLLQLSPTNKEQGRAAIRFATQHDLRKFLIVSEKDYNTDSYSKDLIQAYHDAIDEFNRERQEDGDIAGVVGKYKLDQLPSKDVLEKSDPDCVLYAGDLEAAHGLLNALPGLKSLVILSDSTLASRLSDNALKDFTLVRFTYQTDAVDYNDHTNIYGRDAYAIAQQLIGDLDKRGGDFRFWLKSLLHLHSVKDARRNLVHIMEENSTSRTWYRGARYKDEPGTAYVFNQEKRVDGIFHAWQLKEDVTPGSQMVDIDNWHPPRASSASRQKSPLAAKR